MGSSSFYKPGAESMHIKTIDLEGSGITMDLKGGGLMVIYPKFDSDGVVVEFSISFRDPDGRAAEVNMLYQHMTNGPFVEIGLTQGRVLSVKTGRPQDERLEITSLPHFGIPNLSHVELGADRRKLVIDGLLSKVVAWLA